MHQNCTDLNLYLHKFPGGNTPDPQTGEGVSPLSLARASTVHSHLFRASAAAAPSYPNMQHDFTNPNYIFLYF